MKRFSLNRHSQPILRDDYNSAEVLLKASVKYGCKVWLQQFFFISVKVNTTFLNDEGTNDALKWKIQLLILCSEEKHSCKFTPDIFMAANRESDRGRDK